MDILTFAQPNVVLRGWLTNNLSLFSLGTKKINYTQRGAVVLIEWSQSTACLKGSFFTMSKSSGWRNKMQCFIARYVSFFSARLFQNFMTHARGLAVNSNCSKVLFVVFFYRGKVRYVAPFHILAPSRTFSDSIQLIFH